MPRKPVTTKVRAAASPLGSALDRIAKLVGAAVPPDRITRETEKIVADWRAEPDADAGGPRERFEALRENIAEGLASAREQADDVDQSDKAAVRQAAASVAGLRAVLDVIEGALTGR